MRRRERKKDCPFDSCADYNAMIDHTINSIFFSIYTMNQVTIVFGIRREAR